MTLALHTHGKNRNVIAWLMILWENRSIDRGGRVIGIALILNGL